MNKTTTIITRIIGLFFIVLISYYLLFVQKTTSHKEIYSKPHNVLPGLNIDEFKGFGIAQLRDFAYHEGTTTSEQYSFQAYSISDVQGATYHQSALKEGSPFAHGFITFDMGERFGFFQHIGLSVEARLEPDESYSPWKGLWGQYELYYLWATERDLVSRRTNLYRSTVESHPLELSQEELEILLESLVNATILNEQEPLIYNSLVHNCISVLRNAINDHYGSIIPWDRALVFTNQSVRYLKDLGYITTE